MNDIIDTLRTQRDHAIEQRTGLKRQLEDLARAAQKLNAQVQQVVAQRRDLAEPYKVATERVADLTTQIEAEERRRQEEAAAARAAEEAARKAQAAANAAKAEQERQERQERESQVVTANDVGELEP